MASVVQLGNLSFFPPIFSLKQISALVALPLFHGPMGMLWAVATEHQSTQGRDAPREEVILHCLEWWHKGQDFGEGCHHLILAAVAAQGWLVAFYELQVVRLLGLPLWG